MKVRSSVKKICKKSCQFVRREGVLRIICKANRKHNQKQGKLKITFRKKLITETVKEISIQWGRKLMDSQHVITIVIVLVINIILHDQFVLLKNEEQWPIRKKPLSKDN